MLVGSVSSFGEAAAAVSTNVKVMLEDNQTQQDRVNLDAKAIVSSGAVSSDEQSQVDTAIDDWWHCSEEFRRSTGSGAESLAAASQFWYQTVDAHV